jgi:hypothetical protein
VELKFFGKLHSNTFGFQELHDLGAIFHLGASGVSQGEPGATIFETKNIREITRVLIAKAPFLPNLGVPILGQGFG